MDLEMTRMADGTNNRFSLGVQPRSSMRVIVLGTLYFLGCISDMAFFRFSHILATEAALVWSCFLCGRAGGYRHLTFAL